MFVERWIALGGHGAIQEGVADVSEVALGEILTQLRTAIDRLEIGVGCCAAALRRRRLAR
jgi:hypothetical protein